MKPQSLFSLVNIDKLSEAMDAVTDHFDREGVEPETSQLLQAIILLYDMMNDPGISVTVTQHRTKQPEHSEEPEMS